MDHPSVIPGRYTPWFARGFGKYVRWLIARRFEAVRLERTGLGGDADAPLASLDQSDQPLIILMSHSSWWDPLVGVLLGRLFFPSRSACIPMDGAMLRKLGMFRRLGMFGIDPDDPASLPALARYVADRFAREPRPTLWITPQGEFADPRAPIRLRPGAALVASRTPRATILLAHVEYAFWLSQRPEVLLRVARCDLSGDASRRDVRACHEALQSGMIDNARALANAAISREPGRFRVILGSGASSIIDTSHRRAARTSRERGEASPTNFTPPRPLAEGSP